MNVDPVASPFAFPSPERTGTILPVTAGGSLGLIASVQILQVCRQLLDEGVTILYGSNRFSANSYQALTSIVQVWLANQTWR